MSKNAASARRRETRELPMLRDDTGDGGERYTSTLPSRDLAILMINEEAMKDEAFKYVYKVRVLRDFRRVLMWSVAYMAKYARHPTAGELGVRIETANDCSEPKARDFIKWAEDHDLISSEKDGTKVFYFYSKEQLAKLYELANYLAVIPAVVNKQRANPTDPAAGSELLPQEVYYNVVSQMEGK
jgi:hypothetical protein